ncbi:MAG TPA: peptidase [Propionibacteriaceae bacterium]|nr:peptidase [Propionibacteriaceae bacterium]
MSANRPSVEVSPLQSRGSLYGFLVSGRWPDNTVEWAQFLVLAVRMAAVPGLLPMTTVFSVREEVPDDPRPTAIGLVVAEGPLIGHRALSPGLFGHPYPAGLVVLHPPSSTMSSVPDIDVASGCVFLPGLPMLGLSHQAVWVEAGRDGTVTHLVSKTDVDPASNADTAALSVLLAA